MNVHDGRVIFCEKNVKIIECSACGFSHMYPLPSPESLELIYKNQYYSEDKSDYIEGQENERDWWFLNYSSRLNKIKNLMGGTGRILDIGSGPGLFLQAAMQSGWKALGIEPNNLAADHARSLGCEVIESFLDDIEINKIGKFNAIHCSEVLEHLVDPISVVKKMKDFLEKDGLVYCLVPNDFNKIQSIITEKMKYKKWWVSTPHHINYFKHETLINLFTKIGFKIIHVSSTFPIDLFLLMNLNYIENKEIGKYCHNLRMNFEKNLLQHNNLEFIDEIYSKFAEMGIGREIVLVARKID